MLDKVYSTERVLAFMGIATVLFLATIYAGGWVISTAWTFAFPMFPLSLEQGALVTTLLIEVALVLFAPGNR